MGNKSPGPFGQVGQIATTITHQQRSKLENHLWCVYTEDKITQDAIAEHLTNTGSSEDCQAIIRYNGKELPVFKVTFSVVMFLRKNKSRGPYTYTAYHKESTGSPWVMWKEGMKSPAQIVSLRFQGTYKTTGNRKPPQKVA